MAKRKPQKTAYQIKMALSGIKPPIWRRFSVPGEITLDRLHDVIQIVMGWEEMHLHCFEINGQRYTEAPEDADLDGVEEGRHRLCDLIKRPKAKFTYEYDFGDGWHHTLVIEKITPVPKDHEARIVCLHGRRSCPPEDVGGIWGYGEFLAALANPEHAEHTEYLEWCGGEFDPDAFDEDTVNLELLKYARWSRPRVLSDAL